MNTSTKTQDARIAEKLILINGKNGDVIVGNGKSYLPVHIENGNAFRTLLEKMNSEGLKGIEKNLVDLFFSKRIIVEDKEIIRMPPNGANSCCGIMGEQTLVLPLEENVEDEIYEKMIDYQMAIIENNGVLNIKLYGSDPVTCWPLLKKIITLIDDKLSKMEHHILIRYHFVSKLQNLPNKMIRWIKKHNVDFTVFLPLARGLEKVPDYYETVIENVRTLSKECVSVWFVTPTTKKNISDLLQIAGNYANIGNTIGFEFPAVQSFKYCWKYEKTNNLPNPDEYSQVLVDLYNAQIVSDDMFSPVNELRHRITKGGYLPSCSCYYDHITLVKDNGNIYPCELAANYGSICYGNVKTGPENNIENALREWDNVKAKYWEKCEECEWQYLCGGKCPLSFNSDNDDASINHDKLVEEYICQPRIKLLKSMTWDIVKNLP